MAFAETGNIPATNNSKTAGSTLTLNYRESNAAGILFIVGIACDNLTGTSDGDKGDLISVVDNAGNTYTKIGEFSNVQGGAASGATVAAYYCVLSFSVTSSNVITATFNGSPVARAIFARSFTITSGNSVAVQTTSTAAYDGVDVGSATLSGLPSQEYLFARFYATEAPINTISSAGANYFSLSDNGGAGISCTTGGGSASNIAAHGSWQVKTGTASDACDPLIQAADHATLFAALYETTPTPTGVKTMLLMGVG